MLKTYLFLGTNNRNRASERYHIPHKKAVKDQQQQQQLIDDKENFATPLETPIRRQRSKKNAPDMMITPVLSPSKSMDSGSLCSII